MLVTGAATGIGAAAVQVLAAAGASVVATHHRAGSPLGSPATWLQCDVTDEHAVRAMTGEAARVLGGLDVLVHAAGTWQPGFPGQLSGEQIDTLIAATKGAVQARTRSIAKAWAGDRITANALAPAMQTPGANGSANSSVPTAPSSSTASCS